MGIIPTQECKFQVKNTHPCCNRPNSYKSSETFFRPNAVPNSREMQRLPNPFSLIPLLFHCGSHIRYTRIHLHTDRHPSHPRRV